MICRADRARGPTAIDCLPQHCDRTDLDSADVRSYLRRDTDIHVLQDRYVSDVDVNKSVLSYLCFRNRHKAQGQDPSRDDG